MNSRERLPASIIILHRLRTLLSTPERLPMKVGGKDGGQFIRRMIIGDPSLCRYQLRLSRDLFIELVHTCERKLMSNGRFIEVAEQVGMCLYILSR